MKKVKKVITVLLTIGGIGFIGQNSILSGILIIILGLILYPTISNILKDKFPFWNKKTIRYGAYFLFLIISSALNSSKSGDSTYKSNSSDYQTYLNAVSSNIENLSPEGKESRNKTIQLLKNTSTYKSLVDSSIVSPEYLPSLTSINDALRNVYINTYKEEVFGIGSEFIKQFKSQKNPDDKEEFIIRASQLATSNKGGYTKELINVFERYRKKYNSYGEPSIVYSTDGSSRKEIKHSYDMTSLFYFINPTEKNFNAIYEVNKKGIGYWGNKTEDILHFSNNHLITKQGHIEYAKEHYPDSPYLLKVDKEVWATDLYKRYKTNEVLADEIYKGKKLAITGTIEDINKNFLGEPYINLKIGFLQSVTCNFNEDYIKELSKLSKGQRIIIIGKCKGLLLTNIVVDDCSIWEE